MQPMPNLPNLEYGTLDILMCVALPFDRLANLDGSMPPLRLGPRTYGYYKAPKLVPRTVDI